MDRQLDENGRQLAVGKNPRLKTLRCPTEVYCLRDGQTTWETEIKWQLKVDQSGEKLGSLMSWWCCSRLPQQNIQGKIDGQRR